MKFGMLDTERAELLGKGATVLADPGVSGGQHHGEPDLYLR